MKLRLLKNAAGKKVENFIFFLVWIRRYRDSFYWTLKWLINAVLWPALHMVVKEMTTSLYGGFGYGALICLGFSRLKKNCLLCRYSVSCQKILQVLKDVCMSKRELIDYICKINKTAKPEFLASFSEEELNDYLEHLMELDLEELVACS